MTEPETKVGVIGAGRVANISHLPVLTRLKDVKVEAICDIDKDCAERTARRFGVPRIYRDVIEMLGEERLDLVDVLTPPDTHAEMALLALERGIDCMMEKPLATTLGDADSIIAAAREHHRAVFVTHNWSFFPERRRAKELAAAGAIGEVLSVDVRYLGRLQDEVYVDQKHWIHKLPGRIFADITPHLAMLLLDFVNGEIREVKAVASKVSAYPWIAADEFKVVVEAGRALGSISVNYGTPFKHLEVEVVGTRGSLLTNSDTQSVLIRKPIKGFREVFRRWQGFPRALGALGEVWQQFAGIASTSLRTVAGTYDYLAGHRYLIAAAIRQQRCNGTYPVSLEKCRQVVYLTEAIWNSLGERMMGFV